MPSIQKPKVDLDELDDLTFEGGESDIDLDSFLQDIEDKEEEKKQGGSTNSYLSANQM